MDDSGTIRKIYVAYANSCPKLLDGSTYPQAICETGYQGYKQCDPRKCHYANNFVAMFRGMMSSRMTISGEWVDDECTELTSERMEYIRSKITNK